MGPCGGGLQCSLYAPYSPESRVYPYVYTMYLYYEDSRATVVPVP